jgi:hypothetical protein
MRRVSFFLEDLPFSPIFLLLLPFLLPTSAAREGTNPPPQPNRWEQGQQIKQVKYRSQRSWPRRQLFILVGSVTLMAQIDQATNILQRGPIISKNLTLSPQILQMSPKLSRKIMFPVHVFFKKVLEPHNNPPESPIIHGFL